MIEIRLVTHGIMLTSPLFHVGFQYLFEFGGIPISNENPGTDGRLQSS